MSRSRVGLSSNFQYDGYIMVCQSSLIGRWLSPNGVKLFRSTSSLPEGGKVCQKRMGEPIQLLTNKSNWARTQIVSVSPQFMGYPANMLVKLWLLINEHFGGVPPTGETQELCLYGFDWVGYALPVVTYLSNPFLLVKYLIGSFHRGFTDQSWYETNVT